MQEPFEAMHACSLPDLSVVLSPAMVRGYLAATDDDSNPAYAGMVPPLLMAVVCMRHVVQPAIGSAGSPGDPRGTACWLHTHEEVSWEGPLPVGGVVKLVSKAVAVPSHPAGPQRQVLTEVRCAQDGVLSLAARVRSSLLWRGRTPRILLRPPAVAWGEEIFRRVWHVAAEQASRFAAASGDRNPIHLRAEAAAAAGFRAPILHGLCTMAFVQRTIVDAHLGGDPARLRGLEVHFLKPVFPNDVLTCIASPGEPPEGAVMLRVLNQQGRRVLLGKATIGQPYQI